MVQQFTGLGQGFRVGNRIHTSNWHDPATDFWMTAAGTAGFLSASTAVGALAAVGWTATAMTFTNTATGDFLSSADHTPAIYISDATADVLLSPRIFGSYSHALMVSKFLGYFPTKLCAEWYGAFTVASANEAATFIGFDSGALVAAVYSNATNFLLSNAAQSATDAGIAVDNAYHLWKIVKDATNDEWFVDGASQGTVAVSTDLYPVAFGLRTSTTNRIALNFAHVWYE